jgi:hypothetical protein
MIMAKPKNTIILKAEGELEDKLCREILDKIFTKIETLNDRTKNHTWQIHALQKEIKELKK